MSFNVRFQANNCILTSPKYSSHIYVEVGPVGNKKQLYAWSSQSTNYLKNNETWQWNGLSGFLVKIVTGDCEDGIHTISGYSVVYSVQGDSTYYQKTISGSTGQITITISNQAILTYLQITAQYSGGGGGVTYVTGNVWALPNENAGSILFNGNQATQQQGNLYSYTFSQGTNIQLTAASKEGYEFLYWNDGVTNNPWNIGNRTEGFGATATFQLIPQTKVINIYQNGNWEDTGAVKKYQNGEWVDLPAHIYRNGQWEDL